MVASISAQDQIADLMANAMPEQIVNFKFSNSIQNRINILIEKKKETSLSFSENDELEKYLMYDLLIGLAKARYYKHLHKK
jgi:hypothetical protein